MGKCKQCGTVIEDNAEYCQKCANEMTDQVFDSAVEEKEILEDDFDLDSIDIDGVDISDFDLENLNLDEIDLENITLEENEDMQMENFEIKDFEKDMTEEDASEESKEDNIIAELKEEPESLSDVIFMENQAEAENDILEMIQDKEEALHEEPIVDTSTEEEAEVNDILDVLDFGNDNSDNQLKDTLDLESLEQENTEEIGDDLDLSMEMFKTGEKSEQEENVMDSELEQEQFGLDSVLGGIDGFGELGDLFSEDEKAEAIKNNENLEGDIDVDILDMAPDVESQLEEMEKEDQKKKLFSKLFGNVKDSKWEKEKEKQAQEAEEARLKAEEEEKLKEVKREEEEQKKKEKEEKKAAKLAAKKAAKEEKARLKQEKKELQKEIVEEEDTGRINRAGATIVFGFFAILAVIIVVGTNLFSYEQGVNRAAKYFETKKYSKAYQEIRGLNIKEKDNKIYQKIMTVMYVNKELNSYNNYYNSKLYSEALDSLLKGLERYDKYLSEAEELEIEEDLDYVKNNILKEMQDSFGLTEKEAYSLIEITNAQEYTDKIVKVTFSN